MIYKFLNAMLFCLLGGAAFAVESPLTCDFQSGIPQTWAQYDLDLCTPSKNSQALGFEVGKGWIVIDDEGNNVAASTSWYTPAGTANDWLVTEAVAIGSDYQLRFRHRTTDSEFPDGFSVYVSTKGNSPEDFDTAESLLRVSTSAETWTNAIISLSKYSGQQVWIAFVNDTHDSSRLYIDDVYAGPAYDASFTIDIPAIASVIPTTINGTIHNVSDSDINGFAISLSIGKQEIHETFNVIVSQGASYDFYISPELSLTTYETAAYKATLEIGGKTQFVRSGTIAYIPRRVVVEECTGTWCGWCVRGTVAFDRLTKQYPDNFIGIAVHNKDALTITDYDSALTSAFGVTGFPAAVFNREFKIDPGDMYYCVDERVLTPSPAYVQVSADYDYATQIISARADYTAIADIAQPLAVTFVLIENDVVTDDLYQTNYYSGTSEDMDGWENLGKKVTSAEKPFQHVARHITRFSGHADSKVDYLTAGENISFSYDFSMPENVLNPTNTRLIALLLNTETKEVVNADEISLAPFFDSGIDNVSAYHSNDGKPYNLQGMKVGADYKGIVIVDGKKMLRK